jgi:hypothetical protein
VKRLRVRPFGFGKFVLTIELIAFFYISLRPATDPDYGWHVVNGSHVLDGSIFGGRDLYSWTATGLWVAHEWLTEWFMRIADVTGGRALNSFLAATLIAGTYAVLAFTLRHRSAGWRLVCLTLLVAFSGSLRSLAVRPHVVEMLAVAVVSLLVDAYLRGTVTSRRFIVLLSAGSVLWANMHGSFPLACAIVSITAIELGMARDGRWRLMLIAALISAGSFILNPWGLHLYEFALQSIRSTPTLSYIQEWQRPVLTEWIAIPLILQLSVAAVGVLGVLLRRPAHESGVPAMVGTLRALAFAVLAVKSGRHVMIFGIANAAILAVGLQTLWRLVAWRKTASVGFNVPVTRGVELVNALAAIVVAAVIAFAGWHVVSPQSQRRALASQYPVGVLPALTNSFTKSDRLLNEYRWGGFLIEESTIPVFIDGRSELYGDAQLERYASIVHLERGWKERIDGMGITHVLMARESKLASALALNGWIVTASDSVALLLERKLD